MNGRVIGEHSGAVLFTIGERHGFSIHDKSKTPHDEPYYVVTKDVAENTITVSQKPGEAAAYAKKEIRLTDVNWTCGRAPEARDGNASALTARPRYRAPLVPISVSDVDLAARTCTAYLCSTPGNHFSGPVARHLRRRNLPRWRNYFLV